MQSDAEIRRILVERIDGQQQSLAIVVGVVGPDGRRVISQGCLEKGDARELSGDTIFEIGSVTKIFTALLLAEMTQRAEVALDDPIAKYLPNDVKVPEMNGRVITLGDLATHTSGLPRMPTNWRLTQPENPYAGYSIEQMYEFLGSYELPRVVGSEYEYSNIGFGLLGHGLSLGTGLDYESLVRSRITDPLGMSSTRMVLDPEMDARLAPGHRYTLETTGAWDMPPAFAGAGGLRSSMHDLLRLLSAHLGHSDHGVIPTTASMLRVRHSTGKPRQAIALAWHILVREDREILWHGGSTGGYDSCVAVDLKSNTAVAVLSNCKTNGVEDIAVHFIDPTLPLAKPSVVHNQVPAVPRWLELCVGTYRQDSGELLQVVREGDRLFMEGRGGRVELFAKSEREYFSKIVDVLLVFLTDGGNAATGLIVHHHGRRQLAKRMTPV